MTTVNIAATFRRDERRYNGLEAIAKNLLDRDNPTVRFDAIEVLEGDAADTAKEMLATAYRARTGRDSDPQDTLPFEANQPARRAGTDVWLGDKAED